MSTNYSVGYLFEHAFDSQLKLRQRLRYFDHKEDTKATWTDELDADQRTLNRWNEHRRDRSSTLTSDTSLQYDWRLADFANTTLIGFDYLREKHSTRRTDRTEAALDLYNPVYGVPLGDETPGRWGSDASKTTQVGFYLQNQTKIAEKWVILLGGRHDQARYDDTDLTTGEKLADGEKSRAFTGRAGLVYLAENGLAPYVSYSQSFEPTSGHDREGNRFKPTEGEQYEVGVRYQPKGTDTMLSAAVYTLTQKNVLVTDPVSSSFSVQQGEVQSRGVELEAKTPIGRNVNLIAAYSYIDAKTTKSSPLTPEQEGKRTSNIPVHTFSLWSDYRLAAFGLPGLQIGAGARHVGSFTGWYDAPVSAVTLIDAMVSYTTGPWRVALNVSNLTDKTYAADCCSFGEPRKATVTATYRW